MKPILTLVVIIMALQLVGCSSVPMPTSAQIEAADCGPYPTEYQSILMNTIGVNLRDPASAEYRFTKPVKGAISKTPIFGGGLDYYGWVVEVWVNAKNGYGGYVGEQHHTYIIRNGIPKLIINNDEIDRIMNIKNQNSLDNMYKSMQ